MIVVPEALARSPAHADAAGRAWIAGLPKLAGDFLERWELRPAGEPRHGVIALVLPVRRADGAPAALKLQPVTEDTAGESTGLRAWRGRGAALLLDHDQATGTMLLEGLDGDRSLSTVPDHMKATRILAELLARLVSAPPPAGLRTLDAIAGRMVADAPGAAAALTDPDDRRLLLTCTDVVRELLPAGGDRMLHWDLHFDNVLAGTREPWLAIDPQPMAGDPAFELLPALDNRFADLAATGDVARAVRRRFDLMVEVVGLDRRHAARWTLGRVLQNLLWDIEDGETRCHPEQAAIARALLPLATR